ncbi:MAG: hypothetical protein EU549_03145 [Promethearchaeota archaeon]|nr:MAG: hypothetical protein EU549_03145 [Candidatus Lokiarchaeota archaeon]
MKCEYCKKIFPRSNKRMVRHTNTRGSFKNLYFCSKKCHEQWLKEIQNPKVHHYVVWKIIRFLGNFTFHKQVIENEGIIPELGPSQQNSHFSLDLHENIEKISRF